MPWIVFPGGGFKWTKMRAIPLGSLHEMDVLQVGSYGLHGFDDIAQQREILADQRRRHGERIGGNGSKEDMGDIG